jgi:hypothetical protein
MFERWADRLIDGKHELCSVGNFAAAMATWQSPPEIARCRLAADQWRTTDIQTTAANL